MEQSKWGAKATGENQRSAPLGKEVGQARRRRDIKTAAPASQALTCGQNIFVCGRLHSPKVAAYSRSATDDLFEAAWSCLLAVARGQFGVDSASNRPFHPKPIAENGIRICF
jgi:hypothetical protein